MSSIDYASTPPRHQGEFLERIVVAIDPVFIGGADDDEFYSRQKTMSKLIIDADEDPLTWQNSPTDIERAMMIRDRVIATHARGKDAQDAFTSLMHEYFGGNIDWYHEAYNLGRAVLEREVEIIGEEARAYSTKWGHDWSVKANVLEKTLFPYGDFLLHTTNVHSAHNVLTTGKLQTSLARAGNDQPLLGIQPTISWSLNQVDAMPITPYHPTGFIASPQTLLRNNLQLIVPVDAAPFEVQTLPSGVNINEFRAHHAQTILWQKATKEYGRLAETQGANFDSSNCMQTLRRFHKQISKGEPIEQSYTFGVNGVEFDARLLGEQTSPLAILMIALAEGRDLLSLGITSAQNLLERIDNIDLLNSICGSVPEYFDDELEAAIAQFHSTVYDHTLHLPQVGIEDMVFVCGDEDYKNVWSDVIANIDTKPQAVITCPQDGDYAVTVPNFVIEKGLGDHNNMQRAIRAVLPETQGTFDWRTLLPNDEVRTDTRSATRIFYGAAKTMLAKSLALGSDSRLVVS